MFNAYNIKQIKDVVVDSFLRHESEEIHHIGFLCGGDLKSLFKTQPEKYEKSKVVGILFAQAEAPFVRNEILPFLSQFHQRTSIHLDIFCAGYCPYLEKDNYPDQRSIKGDWCFSDKAYADLELEIEKNSAWENSGETTLILFEAKFYKGQVKFNFQNSLVLNLEQMSKDKAFSSVRSFIYTIVESLTDINTTFELSDCLGLKEGRSFMRDFILKLLPSSVRNAYIKSEHFAVRNLEKKKKNHS